MSLLAKFRPLNKWKVDDKGPKWKDRPEVPLYIVDCTTGDRYLNQPKRVIRLKLLALLVATPVVHGINASIEIINRLYRLLTFKVFRHWFTRGRCLSWKLSYYLKDILNLLVGRDLWALIALELATIFGLVRPLDGRKLYATIELVQSCYYNHEDSYEICKQLLKINNGDCRALLAPCFQQSPRAHFFRQAIEYSRAW